MQLLSIIVPAHDEARLLGGTLAALADAARNANVACEIVVVDDASTDATAAIARAAGARVLRVAHRQIAATRNAGARVARGERLLFVDADTQVTAEALRAAMAALDAGAVGGGTRVRLAGRPALHTRWLAATLMLGLRLARIAPGCFFFCTRAAFEAAGGFDEAYFAAEDVMLSRALARIGRFVMLRAPVATSNRKLQTFGVLAHFALMLRLALRGPRVLRSRRHLALWYAPRRHAPDEERPAD